jgi:tetratricopeptide (TPR) repeat protein
VHHIYSHYDKDHPAVNKEREFQAVTAACMLIKKDLFFTAGAFDASYLNGYEDVDLCFELRERGYKIVYNPRAVLYHLESKTPGRHVRLQENSRIFRSKWSGRIIADIDNYYHEDQIVVEIMDRQGNVDIIRAHDGNDNIFWQEAKEFLQAGAWEKAEASYLRALKFNPFDPRKGLIARDLAALYKTLGKHPQADKFNQMAAAIMPQAGASAPQGCRTGPDAL